MRDIAREQLLEELRALRPEFERMGVRRMALFGSRARGDNRPDSDVDLIVDIEPGIKLSGLDAAGLYGVIEERLGLESSIITSRGLPTDRRFEDEVRRDRIDVF